MALLNCPICGNELEVITRKDVIFKCKYCMSIVNVKITYRGRKQRITAEHYVKKVQTK